VHLEEHLRHTGTERSQRSSNPLVLAGCFRQRISRLLERGKTGRGSVLDLKLEATHQSQPIHRRRWEYPDETFLNASDLLLDLGGHCRAFDPRLDPLMERLQRYEHARRVGLDAEGDERKTRQLDYPLHPRSLADQLRQPRADHLGPFQRRAVRQLEVSNQVALVLRRNESAGHMSETEPG